MDLYNNQINKKLYSPSHISITVWWTVSNIYYTRKYNNQNKKWLNILLEAF